jgi:Zn-dependent alcohol dehydrogenase
VVGSPATFRQAVDLLAVGGTACLVGVAGDDIEVSLPMTPMLLGRTVKGVYLGSTRPQHDIPVYAEWWRTGTLDLAALVTERVSLRDIERSYARLVDGPAGRTVVVFDDF